MHFPAQSQEHVRGNNVLLQRCPSLRGLRGKLPCFIRPLHRYYGARAMFHIPSRWQSGKGPTITADGPVIYFKISVYELRKVDQIWTKLQGQLFAILFIYLERETGIEPATFSLGS